MTISSTGLMALDGLLHGTGLTVAPSMTLQTNNMLSNSLFSLYVNLNKFTGNTTGLNTVLANLPPIIGTANVLKSNVDIRNSQVLPDQTIQGYKTFFKTLNTASNFVGQNLDVYTSLAGTVATPATDNTTLETSRAATTVDTLLFSNISLIANLSPKTISSYGVGVTSYQDIVTHGLSSIFTNISALVAPTAKRLMPTMDFVSLTGKNQHPVLYATQAEALNDITNKFAIGIQNFGTLYDFADLVNFGTPQALFVKLQDEGFADRFNLNFSVTLAGYDPAKPYSISSNVLTNAFGEITGDDLDKVLNVFKIVTLSQPASLNDLLLLETFMPTAVITALGIPTKSNLGMKLLANKLLNAGLNQSSIELQNFSTQSTTANLPFLANLKTLILPSTLSNLTASLGSWSSGVSLSDMLGTVAGIPHTSTFANINSTLETIQLVSPGLVANILSLGNAVINDHANASTYVTSLNSNVSALNSQLLASTTYTSQLTITNNLIDQSNQQIVRELVNNGLSSTPSDGATPDTSISDFMSFVSRLYDFGADKKIGYQEILSSMATLDLAGDSIRAAMLAGQNQTAKTRF